MINYGDLIKQLRLEKKVSILTLAKRMGVSPQYIVKLEIGEIQPTKEQVETLQSFVDGRL